MLNALQQQRRNHMCLTTTTTSSRTSFAAMTMSKSSEQAIVVCAHCNCNGLSWSMTIHSPQGQTQQMVTNLQQSVGVVSEASALETNRKPFLFVGPDSASSQTSAGQLLHLAKSLATSCVWLCWFAHHGVLGIELENVLFLFFWKMSNNFNAIRGGSTFN